MNQARRKILFLITKGFWGGAQQYVFDIVTNLPRDQFDPVVAYGSEGKLSEDLAIVGIKTFRLPSLARDVSFRSDVKSFFEILAFLRNERPEIVHLNSSKAGALGALAGRLAGVRRIVFTAHGWPFREDRGFLSRVAIWCASWLTALLATDVICVSDADLAAARRMPLIGKKAVRIYNGIDLHKSYGNGDLIRSAFPPGIRITGTVAELTKNKNIGSLIEAAKNDPNKYLAIVGEGEERTRLEQMVHEYGLETRVKFFGFIRIEEVIRGFDVFALPSIKEGLPYVVIEARAAGIPIEANRVGGVGEILDAKDLSEFSLENMLKRTTLLYLK
ncbi:MAG: glycosyltransferase [Candidatus Pacebacteria bacterium]|nr:glycosyltransferase [Candidatus Paceibacterota bacterium]